MGLKPFHLEPRYFFSERISMNREDAAKALGVSLRTLERWAKTGKIKATKRGQCLEFSYADLGLPEPAPTEPKPAPAPVTPAQPVDDWPEEPTVPVEDTTHTPDAEPSVEDLDGWTDEELKEGVKRWRMPSDPNAPPSNVPAAHSSSMPSPENFARLIRANAILEFRSFGVQPKPRAGKPGQAFSVGMLGPSRHPDSYRPATGYGLTQQDLEAESLTLRLHPEFARNRYTR